jgi:hypothetical protein
MRNRDNSDYVLVLLCWAFATFVVFSVFECFASAVLNTVAPWMVTNPCADQPFNCEGFIYVNHVLTNVILLLTAGLLTAAFGWWVANNEVEPRDCDCDICSEISDTE